MPKRKQDATTAPSPRPLKVPGSPKNKERAYIAASRRSDRKLEDRMRSAELASQVHKERTGRGFKITEEIVLRQEMYEEEDESLPRSYMLLGPHMQTGSHEMNRKVDAYLTNKMAMSALIAKSAEEWRANEINQLFEKSFPNATAQALQLTNEMKKSPSASIASPGSAMSPTFQDLPSRPQSVNPTSPTMGGMSPPPQPHVSRQLSSSTVSSEMAQSSIDSIAGFSNNSSRTSFSAADDSPFTSELPNDVKSFMTGISKTANPFMQGAFDPSRTNYAAPFNPTTNSSQMGDSKAHTAVSDAKPDMTSYLTTDEDFLVDPILCQGEVDPTLEWDIPHPMAGDEPSWDSFIDEGAWGGASE